MVFLDAAGRRRRESCPRAARSRSAAAACASPASTARPSTAGASPCGCWPSRENGGLSGAALEVLAILLAALIAAFAFALTVSRSLQAQIQRPARRPRSSSARATSAIEVPTEGNDEFAALGIEFNKMARQLERAAGGAAARAQAAARGDPPRRPVVRARRSSATRCSRSSVADGGRRRRRPRRARGAAHRARSGRFEEIAGEGDVSRYRDAIGAAEAAALDAGTTVETEVGDGASRSRTRCAPQDSAAHPRHALGRPRRARRSPRASASCSATSPARPASRSRTSTCTTRSAPGRHRRADRPVQPPPLPGGHRQRGRARQALRPRRWA